MFARRRMVVVMAAVLLAAADSWVVFGQGTLPADDFQPRLDAVQFAACDFGNDGAAVTALSDLVASTRGKPEQRRQIATRLAGMLGSDSPYVAKQLACRYLSMIGTTDQVPALAALLTDQKLSHMARYALEKIPGPAADEALRAALGTVKGPLLVGIINSVGARRDAGSVDALARLLEDADPIVAAAAANSLGKIGGPASVHALAAAGRKPGPVRRAALDASLDCADRLLSEGKRDEAVAIYDSLRQADVPQAVRRGAVRGAILARQADGIALFVEQIKASDPDLFAIALRLIREMPGSEVTKAAADSLAGLPPPRQTLVIGALADRGDKSIVAVALALAEKGDVPVRAAAIQSLTRLGDASLVPMLLQIAAGSDPALSQSAMTTLATMPDKQTVAAVIAVLEKSDAAARRLGINLLALRREPEATPWLFRAAADADATVRQPAIKALGGTVRLAELDQLADLLTKAAGGEEIRTIEEAIAAACARIADKSACVDKMMKPMPRLNAEGKSALLRALSQVGGAKALETVRAAVRDPNPELQDVAARALSNWADTEAAGDLAEIVKATSNSTHKVLALRGYIRLIGRADVAVDKKLAMCTQAMAMADRDDEKKLVLGVLGGMATTQALDMAISCVDRPAMKNEAGTAAITIGERLLSSDPAATAKAMNKVLSTVEDAGVKKRAQELMDRTKIPK